MLPSPFVPYTSESIILILMGQPALVESLTALDSEVKEAFINRFHMRQLALWPPWP